MSKHHIFIVQLLGLVLLTSSFSYARVCFPGIGDKAPSFTAQSTEGKIRFPGDYKGKWIIFLVIRPILLPYVPPNSRGLRVWLTSLKN